MAPPRRPGLTILVRSAPADDDMVVLIWTAVPVECCSPQMREFRRSAQPLRVADNATWGRNGLPAGDHPEHPTIRHWQLGGVVLFGYDSEWRARYAAGQLASFYVARSGKVAHRDPP
jgi:hypothetical protein